MAVLQKGKSIYPFWGAPVNIITGLDPLSLQNTSEATYSTLLPGISNLTNRLRYFGFYCWLLDFYFQREKKGNSFEQYKFIRRAELMIALLMQTERSEVLQITGSFFAINMIEGTSKNYFDLAAGADKDGSDKVVYWKYPSGAFGQYYYGSMRALSLVIPVQNSEGDMLYSVSQEHQRQRVSGKQLADAFALNLSQEIKDLFYRNIKAGKLIKADIPQLAQFFAIDAIDSDSQEWGLYVSMLLDKDDPNMEVEEDFTFHRRETIQGLLKSAIDNHGNYDWKAFLIDTYETKLKYYKDASSETMNGWYAYKFNEYYQYACGAIFWSILQELHNEQYEQNLPNFIQNVSKSLVDALGKEIEDGNNSFSVEQFLNKFPSDLDEQTIFDNIETKPNSNAVEAGKNGFLLLFRIFLKNKEHLYPLKAFMSQHNMLREGNMLDGLIELNNSKEDNIESFVNRFIFRRIIYRHQKVAIRKMGNGSQSTHKFIIEDEYIRLIDTFPPRETSPRMVALTNLLSDLNLLNEDGQLTDLATKILDA